MSSDNPFPDSLEDIERRAVVGRIDALRQMVKVIESAAAKVVEGLDELESRYEDTADSKIFWEAEDETN
jgi:hypothetical protein